MFHTKQSVDLHVNEVFKNIKNDYQKNLKCFQIAKLYYKLNDYKSAIKYLNRYILTTKNSAPAYRLLGECYLGTNSKTKALNAFKISLELNSTQKDLVSKACTLLMDPAIYAVTPEATYWLEKAESLFPTDSSINRLKEQILKYKASGNQVAQLDKLLLSEIKARPIDVTVRICLLNLFLETKRFNIAYQHALEIESRQIFSNDFKWYDCLCNVMQAYEKENNGLDFIFFIKKLSYLERRADLCMQEFQDEIQPMVECSNAVFNFDQSLHALSVSKIKVDQENTTFYKEFLKHMQAQLSFHLATLVLKRTKNEYGIWSKATRTALPLLLQASQTTMNLEDEWYSSWVGKNILDLEVKGWSKSASLRISQAGHILLSWSQNKGAKFLEKAQYCGGKWQSVVYQDIFYSKEHQQAMATSHFINDSSFSFVPMRLLTETELKQFDEVAQFTYPESLHHLVWLGLGYCNANGYLSHDFRCMTVPNLQFTVENLSQTGPETLNQLDVDAFLYASVLCSKLSTNNLVNSNRPSKLPVSISEELCTPAQAEWWAAVYKTYTNALKIGISEMRLKLRRGIETIRAVGQHGLHAKLLVMLAKLFQERAAGSKNPTETSGLEERAYLYWSAAIPLLTKIEKNQVIRVIPNRLFDYRGSELTASEIKGYLEDGRLFLGCRLMKQGQDEEAVEALQQLRSPYATFYQGLIYEKLASEEVNHRPESITSENRSQHIILLTRARDAFYLTLDRLRCPNVDRNHPLNNQLKDHLEEIEKQLTMIDPDNSLKRNGDTESDETDTVPHPLSPDIDDNVGSNLNAFNVNSFLSVKSLETSRTMKKNLSDKQTRFEARPSPERLDAQLRHLVQANNNGLQAVVEQLKEIKSVMQIEMKDLGCVTRDLLAEMKRWNGKLESLAKREMDTIKPEELFNLEEEDYEDLSQLSQAYTPYQNYLVNRQIPGTQGTSTVTYGTSVPSPVSSAIPNIENPLLPPALYPGPQLDPSALLYHSLGYYQGLPYTDVSNLSDIRGTGAQKELRKKKGISLVKGSYRAPDAVLTAPATVPTTVSGGTINIHPPNVVITSSDVLPPCTSAGTPALSVTIPPQHIRCSTPTSTVQKFNGSQIHPYQIQMPPTAQLVKENPTEKLDTIVPKSPVQNSVVSAEKPTISNHNIAEEQNLATGTVDPKKTPAKITKESNVGVAVSKDFEKKEVKLFEGKGQLFVGKGADWKEHGTALINVLHDKEHLKLKITFLKDHSNTPLVHFITNETVLEPLKNSDTGWIWSFTNFDQTGNSKGNSAGAKEIGSKFCVQFVSKDEAKSFNNAFDEGCSLLNIKNENCLQQSALSKSSTKQCSACKKPFEGNTEKCSACELQNKSLDKTNVGGFTFVASPIIQAPVLKLPEEKEKPKEIAKPGPFAEFSFSSLATASSISSKPQIANDNKVATDSGSDNFNLFSAVKPDPNSFKKDANFKSFEGQNSLVFGHLNKPKTSPSKPLVSSPAIDSGTGEDKGEAGDDEFVPTAEFAPVIDLPDLVDVKTGEENDKVLFNERVKLLRFETNGKEWKERGIGNMKLLLNEESGKVRLIMRREQVLKVCCNHYLNETMEFSPLKKSERALSWCAQDYSDGDLKTELFALKFKSQDLMNSFLSVVRSTQSKMKDGRVGDKEHNKESQESKNNDSEASKPFSELFKPKAGSWECETCLVQNNKESEKCVSCETPKPGSQGPSSAPTTQFKLLGKGITFPPTTTTFTFGIQPTTSTTAPTSTEKLTFGQNTPTTTSIFSSNANEFSFSAPKLNFELNSTASTTKFTFGIPKSEETTFGSAVKPTFGVSDPKAPSSTPVGKSKTTVPSFNTGDFVFGMPSTETTNSPMTLFSQGSSESGSFFSFQPSNVKTNLGMNIFGGTPLEKTEEQTASTRSNFFIEKEKPKESSGNSIPTFGTSLKLEEKEKSEFSLSNINPVASDIKQKEKISGNFATSEHSDEEPKEDSENSLEFTPVVPLPEKVTLPTGEEDEDVMYEQRAKLYRFVDKEWKERGIGIIKILKHKTNNKIRLLMRREIILKVCLNHYLTPDLNFIPKTDKSWQWQALDFAEDEPRCEVFAIRFKAPEDAEKFMKTINDLNSLAPVAHTEPAEEVQSESMKNFSFGLLNNQASPQSIIKSKAPGEPEEDISIVFENQVTPEQREKALTLHLPPNFYSYLQAPDCPGCPGCDAADDESTTKVQSTVSVPFQNTQPISKPLSFGFESFGQGDGPKEKFTFFFSGNQFNTKPTFNAKLLTGTTGYKSNLGDKKDDDGDDKNEEENEDNVQDEDDDGDDKNEEENEDNVQDEDDVQSEYDEDLEKEDGEYYNECEEEDEENDNVNNDDDDDDEDEDEDDHVDDDDDDDGDDDNDNDDDRRRRRRRRRRQLKVSIWD